MEESLINKRIQELCKCKESLSNKDNLLLFEEYIQQKLNNVPLEDISARTLLILGNRRLIYFVLKKEFNIFIDVDSRDEFGCAQIALIKAVDTYNPESGVNFNTYAYRVIVNAIKMFYRKRNSIANTAERTKGSLYERVGDSDEVKEILLIDVIADDHNFRRDVLENEILKEVLTNIRYLETREAMVIIHYYGLFGNKQKNQKETADIIGLSQSYVSRYCKSAIEKLRILTLDESCLTKAECELKHLMLKNGFKNNLISSDGDVYNN